MSSCGNFECLYKYSHLLPSSIGDKFLYYEHLGLRIRSFVGLEIHDRLNPFLLAKFLGLKVVPLDAINKLTDRSKSVLFTPSGFWSGGATPPLSDGSHVILLNPWQSIGRQSVTLMEEISHILLGHMPSKIMAGDIDQQPGQRTYNKTIEEEAYSTGAAALVPYQALACNISRGLSIKDMAVQAGVTSSLIKYRVRVLRLGSPYFNASLA